MCGPGSRGSVSLWLTRDANRVGIWTGRNCHTEGSCGCLQFPISQRREAGLPPPTAASRPSAGQPSGRRGAPLAGLLPKFQCSWRGPPGPGQSPGPSYLDTARQGAGGRGREECKCKRKLRKRKEPSSRERKRACARPCYPAPQYRNAGEMAPGAREDAGGQGASETGELTGLRGRPEEGGGGVKGVPAGLRGAEVPGGVRRD